MKLKFLSILLVLISILSACSAQNQTVSGSGSETVAMPEGSAPITVTDMLGREVVIDEPVTRIAALTAADCEIVYALGAGDLMVGRGEYCDYPAGAAALPSLQSGTETNIEQILALAPQVVFMADMEQSDEQIGQLEKAGIHVVVSDADDIAGVYTAIRMIGIVLSKNEEAEKLVGSMQKTFAEIEANALPEGSTVYFEVSPLEWGLWTAGKNTFMNEVAELMGLKNCFDDVEGWAEISEEQVLKRNPDLIVTITMYSGEGATPEEEILARSGWETVTAVKNKAVLNLQNNELTRPGPRLTDGAKMLYEFATK